MASKFSSGKYAIAQCDRCNFRFKLSELRIQTLKTKPYRIKVCQTCWEPDHPQLKIGMYPVFDPQAVRDPRPDISYRQSGMSGLQIDTSTGTSELGFGSPNSGSRVIQWGWSPVGLSNPLQLPGINNDLVAQGAIGTVTISIS